MPTGRADCDSTSKAIPRLVAPSAIRTPISLARCSTRYESTLNSPGQRQQKRQSSERQRQPERNLQQICFCPRECLQRGNLAPCWDRRPPGDRQVHCRARSASPRTRIAIDVFADPGLIGRYTPAPSILTPPNRKPATSRATPATIKLRATDGGSSGSRGSRFGSDSSRRICPIASAPGHNSPAVFSDTTATAALALCSLCVKPRPRTRSMSRTPKCSGETN